MPKPALRVGFANSITKNLISLEDGQLKGQNVLASNFPFRRDFWLKFSSWDPQAFEF